MEDTSRFYKGVMLSLAMLAGIISSAANATEINKVIRQARSGTVTVIVYDKNKQPLGNGRGFFIDRQGHLITNYHVLGSSALMGACSARIRTCQGREYPITMVVAENSEADLVKVVVDIPRKDIRFLKLSDVGPIVEERVFVLADFKSGAQQVHWGNITAMEDLSPRKTICRTTVSIRPGLSGSPVINREGEVVAIACGHDIEGQKLSYAIPTGPLPVLQAKTDHEPLPGWFKRVAEQPDAVHRTLHNCYIFVDAGRYAQALDALEIIVRKYSQLPQAWYLLGYCHFKLDQFPQAIESYTRALSLRGDYVDAQFGLGLVYGKMARYDRAIAAIKSVLEHAPDSAEAYYNLSILYGQSGDAHEEVTALQQAIRLKPSYCDAYYSLGTSYAKLGTHTKAIDAFGQLIRLKPGHAKAHFNLGLSYGKVQKYPEAIVAFQRAIAMKPDYAEAHFNLGLAYGGLGRYQEAIDTFKQGVKIKPDDPKGYFFLGRMYKQTDQHNKAIEVLKQAVKIKWDYVEAHFELGLSYLKVGNDMAALAEYMALDSLDKGKAEQLYDQIAK